MSNREELQDALENMRQYLDGDKFDITTVTVSADRDMNEQGDGYGDGVLYKLSFVARDN